MDSRLPIAVLISGSGTTLQNLIDRSRDGSLPVRIVQVISSKEQIQGNDRARKFNLPLQIMLRKSFPSVETYSQAIFETIRHSGAKLVCLGGFLQLLRLPDDFQRRVMNIHPSLLPAFGGKGMYGHHVHEAVLKSGVTESGCTVHYVDDEYDHGEIILQRKVPVFPSDTVDELAFRIFVQECFAYPEAIRIWIREHSETTAG